MNIAINTRLLLPGKLDGIGWFTYYTASIIAKKHPEHTFYFIFDRPYSKDLVFSQNVVPIVGFPPARHPILWHFFFDYATPFLLKKYKIDLYISTDGYLPMRTNVPSVMVLHDLNFVHHPEWIEGSARKYLLNNFPLFAKKATCIATVSRYSKEDIAVKYGIDKEKIDVVYNGINEQYTNISADEIKAIRDIYTDGKPYFLYVGSLHERKNVRRLLQAFDIFKKKTNSPMKLMVVGGMFTKDYAYKIDTFLEYQHDIIFMGRASDALLTQLTPAAFATTFVPLFEGFGLPILESYVCGVPLLTSDLTAIPEIAGDAAIFVDPYSIDSIATGMEKITTNDALRATLIEKGFQQAKKYSWQKTADLLWQTVEKVMDKI